MRISCLHTAHSNIAVFEEAAMTLRIAREDLHHQVRPDLLDAAEMAGGLTDDIENATRQALISLAQAADVVILACSTLGPSVDVAAMNAEVPVLRADGALAKAAADASGGGKVVVLCTVETTIEPTSRLFESAARRSGASVEVQLVEGAWASFKAGDFDAYLSTIAKAAERAYADGAFVVAFGQASMTGAADLVSTGPRPLSSPAASLSYALEFLVRKL